jgi:hypothetical protein
MPIALLAELNRRFEVATDKLAGHYTDASMC